MKLQIADLLAAATEAALPSPKTIGGSVDSVFQKSKASTTFVFYYQVLGNLDCQSDQPEAITDHGIMICLDSQSCFTIAGSNLVVQCNIST